MSKEIVSIEHVARSIFVIRGQKVMLDFDLAALYGVPSGHLNRAVKRNIGRFPIDFMFQLSVEEARNLKCQIGISSWGGRRSLPYAFTDQGVAMLSSVLKSERAVERTRLACWRWRPRHRELLLRSKISAFAIRSSGYFPARRRKGHARRVCSPICHP